MDVLRRRERSNEATDDKEMPEDIVSQGAEKDQYLIEYPNQIALSCLLNGHNF